MEEKKIIVCLDVKNGKTTKGIKFKNNEELGDPYEMAVKYQQDGADEIVLYDITASMEDRTATLELVEKIGKSLTVPFMVGGGISTLQSIEAMLNAGADKLSINSPAVKNPLLIKDAVQKFGTEKIALGVDAMKDPTSPSGFRVYIGGGQIKTDLDLIEWVKLMEGYGAGEVILNSIDADGTRDGYDCEMLKTVKKTVKIPVVASGGAGKLEHIEEMFRLTDADTALVASMVHYGIAEIREIKEYLREKGIKVII